MKVLFISNVYSGLYKFRKELVEKLTACGNEVFLAIPEDEYIGYFEDMGCKTLNVTMKRRGINPISDIMLIKQYNTILKEVKPDIVLTYTIKPNVYAGLICRKKRIKYIANITGLGTAIENSSVISKIALLLYRFGLKDANQVMFQNKYNQEFFEKKKITKTGRLIPGSGVNLKVFRFCKYPHHEEQISFLFVGRIMKDKGIDEFLQCAKQIKQNYPNVVFDIVGSFDEMEYENTIRELDEEGIINYYGEQKNVIPFYESHHALIQPSYHEGLSNVLLENAACGRPCIATNIPGCIEAFDDEITGFGINPQSVEELVRAVEKFIAISYSEKVEMGRLARKKIEEEFSRDIVINAYLEEIEKTFGE